MKITIIGAGYVGLNCGATFAYLGNEVVIVESDREKLAGLQTGQCPIHECGLPETLAAVRERLSFTGELGAALPGSRVAMIAVGTPPLPSGQPDTSFVESAASAIAEAMAPGATLALVLKSTVPVGTNRRVQDLVAAILDKRGIQAEVHVVSNPEFLREGNALYEMLYPDRIVVGANSETAVVILRELYQPILDGAFAPLPVIPERPDGNAPAWLVTPPESAEMIKYAGNAFLAIKISFINEVAGLCERVGADVLEVACGLGLDHRIGPAFLRAGLGWGGSCLPKDTLGLLALGREHDWDLPVLRGAVEGNYRQRQALLEKLEAALGGVRGRTLGLLGLAFKPGTDDVRESTALELVRSLLEAGAQVRVQDPQALETFREAAPELAVTYCRSVQDCAQGADALVLVTDWPEYRQVDWVEIAAAMRGTVVMDGRNHLDREALAQAGLRVYGMGRQLFPPVAGHASAE